MPRSILCQNCGVVLSLPDQIIAGKRMKCPRCAHRFVVTEKDANSASGVGGVADAASLTSQDFGRRPPSHDALPTSMGKQDLRRRPPSQDELPVPVGDHDLREMFDLPMGTAEEIERSAVSGSKPVLSDAEALFQDLPARKRRPKGAEARSQARRCSQCGGLVPQGMSICATCGMDQDTGMRVGLDDDLVQAPPPAPKGPPLHIAIIGLLCGLSAGVLLLLALIQSARGEAGPAQYGWLCLAVVSGFGIYGAVQFYTGKSVKMLIMALTLGVFVNFFSLIVLPIVQANFAPPDRVISRVEVKRDDPDALDLEDVEIKAIAQRIDQQSITLGLIVIGIYVVLCIYLMSPPVKRYFSRQAFFANLDVPVY